MNTPSQSNPLNPFLNHQAGFILDGGLATELEARGYDLNDSLWSARLLIEEPAAIALVHEAYLRAGADCIISASYQATIAGFMSRGQDEEAAKALLGRSVELATGARDRFWGSKAVATGRLRPLVAASVGPYGAFLADGSEYDGRYGLSAAELAEFHRQRWHILANSAADLLACETIPSYLELQALTGLLTEKPKWSWFSFSCRDGAQLHDGTKIEQCAAWLEDKPFVAAIGVNCTAPQHIPELVARLRAATDRPLIVYPNSGEKYDASKRQWHGTVDANDFARASLEWQQLGAILIGGCCRTGPDHIRRLRETLV